jgi:hypothetical protein
MSDLYSDNKPVVSLPKIVWDTPQCHLENNTDTHNSYCLTYKKPILGIDIEFNMNSGYNSTGIVAQINIRAPVIPLLSDLQYIKVNVRGWDHLMELQDGFLLQVPNDDRVCITHHSSTFAHIVLYIPYTQCIDRRVPATPNKKRKRSTEQQQPQLRRSTRNKLK